MEKKKRDQKEEKGSEREVKRRRKSEQRESKQREIERESHTMSERKGRKKEKLAGETKIVRLGILHDFSK